MSGVRRSQAKMATAENLSFKTTLQKPVGDVTEAASVSTMRSDPNVDRVEIKSTLVNSRCG